MQAYPDQVAKINPEDINEVLMKESIGFVEDFYKELGANDRVAKGPDMLKVMKEKLNIRFPLRPQA